MACNSFAQENGSGLEQLCSSRWGDAFISCRLPVVSVSGLAIDYGSKKDRSQDHPG
jgi:hypothetical protein